MDKPEKLDEMLEGTAEIDMAYLEQLTNGGVEQIQDDIDNGDIPTTDTPPQGETVTEQITETDQTPTTDTTPQDTPPATDVPPATAPNGKYGGIYESVGELEKGYKNLQADYTRIAQILAERNRIDNTDPTPQDNGKPDANEEEDFNPFDKAQIEKMVEKKAQEIVTARDKDNDVKAGAQKMLDDFKAAHPDADVREYYNYAAEKGLPDLETAFKLKNLEAGNVDALGLAKDETKEEGDTPPPPKPRERNPSMNRMGGGEEIPPGSTEQYTPQQIAENPRLLDKLDPKGRRAFLEKYA